MNRTALVLAVFATTTAGCGGSSPTLPRAATATAPVTSNPPLPTAPLTDVHGELVSVPALAGGTTLAFVRDGTSVPLEVADPAALLATGVHEGFTGSVTGDALPNAAGRTALPTAVRVAAFQADDVFTGGRLLPGFPGAFVGPNNETWVPDGPLAYALLAAPVDRPLYVTGRTDPSRPATPAGPFLIVTSWRPAVTVSWERLTPLLGTQSFTIDDLQVTGAYRTQSGLVRSPGFQDTRGAGRRLPAAVLSDLQARVAAADLRAQPSTFMPPRLYPDHPTTTLCLADDLGDVAVTIWSGATLPPAVEALMLALEALPATVPTFRSVEQGPTSQIVVAGAEAARDANAWGGLWARHVGGRPLPPQLDFTRELGVGVFDGPRPSGAYTIEVTDLVGIGPNIHLRVVHLPPPGRPVAIPTAPYHFVAIDLAGNTGELWVEGVRLP